MPLHLYFDEDAGQHAIVQPLRENGIPVMTTAEVGALGGSDEDQLALATSRGWVLVSHNVQDFNRLHTTWLRAERPHAGLILVHQGQLSIGECIRRLRRICAERTPDQMRDRAEFLTSWG